MKTQRYAAALGLLVLLLASACVDEQVLGDGAITSRELTLHQALKGARTEANIDLILDPTLSGYARLVGEQNLLEHIKLSVDEHDVLTVAAEDGFNLLPTSPLTLRLPLIDGGRLETTSSGDIKMSGTAALVGERFELISESSGEISLKLQADEVIVSAQSAGDVKLVGQAQRLQVRLESAGQFKGEALCVEQALVMIDSSGDAHVCVSGRIDGELNSSGDLYLKERPEQMNVSAHSAGRIKQR